MGDIFEYNNKFKPTPSLSVVALEWQGFFGQILCRVIISVFYWC